MTLDDLSTIVNSPAALALLLILGVIAGSRRGWVFGWVYQEALEREHKAEERAEAWKEFALGLLPVAEKSVDELASRQSWRGDERRRPHGPPG